MDRPPRPPEPSSDDASAPSAETGAKTSNPRQTTALPSPELVPRQQRSGLHTEALAPPPMDEPPAVQKAPPQTVPVAPPPAPHPTTPSPPAGPPRPSTGAPSRTPAATGTPSSRPARPNRPPRPPSSGLRIAARPRAQVPRPVAWASTVALVLIAGWGLWLVRRPVDQALDRWLTLPSWPQPAAEEEEPVAAVEDTPVMEPEADEGPTWTFETIEAALVPLPQQLQALSDAGKGEVADFADLARRKAPEALQRSRWENWRRVWRNRTSQQRQAMPPLEVCLPHAALESTCLAVDEALVALETVGELPSPDAAPTHLACADAVLGAWRQAEEAARAAEAAALEAAALEEAASEEEASEKEASEEEASEEEASGPTRSTSD